LMVYFTLPFGFCQMCWSINWKLDGRSGGMIKEKGIE
jgi:hypothetical protein